MSFIFASSHLPETRVQRPEDEEEDDVQPMLHSGGVRAFSHLPAKRAAADPAGPLSQRGAQALGHQFQRTEPEGPATPHEDGISAAKASGVFDVVRQQFNRDDSPHFMDEDGNLRPRDETRHQDSPSPRAPRSPQAGAGAPPRPAWSTGHAAAADSSRSPRAPSSASDVPDLGICRPSPPRTSILSTSMMTPPPVPIPPPKAGRRSMTSCTELMANPRPSLSSAISCTATGAARRSRKNKTKASSRMRLTLTGPHICWQRKQTLLRRMRNSGQDRALPRLAPGMRCHSSRASLKKARRKN